MKVAMVSPYSWAHPGGVNNHVVGLGREMMRRGHLVTVIAPDAGGVPPGAAFVHAGRSIPVPANGSIARLAIFPGTGGRVRRALEGDAFDVVHVHEPLVPLVSTSAVLGAGCRVVATFHAAGDGRSLTYGVARMRYGGMFGRIDRLVAVSESARALVSGYFPGSYEVIPNGVDLTRFSPGLARPADFPPPGGKVVLFVGRNEKRKGLSVLLRAFPKVLREVPGCRLVVIGEGFGREPKRLPDGVPPSRVTALGYVENEDLPAYYAAADLVCAPALGGESFGVVLLEAMASGTPVVASDIPGYRDVLRQTGGGRLFETGDPEGLARVLCELLESEDARYQLARAGLERISSFSWEVIAERLEAVYIASFHKYGDVPRASKRRSGKARD